MPTPLENELRATFAAHASQVPSHPDPYRATRRRIDRARRRRIAVTAGTLVAAAALFLGVPPGLHAIDRSDHIAADSQAALRWPTRGSLAGNRALLKELARRAQARMPYLRHSTAHVLYAGDNGKHRVALVAVVGKQGTATVVLTGPSMVPTITFGASPPMPTNDDMVNGDPIMWFDPIGRTLLVVGPPGMSEIEVGAALTFRPDGTAIGKLRTIHAKSGALLAEIPDGVPDSMQIRTRIDGRYSSAQTPLVDSGGLPPGWLTALGNATARAPGHIDIDRATNLLNRVIGDIGADYSNLAYRLWWGGPVGAGRTAIIATVSAPGLPIFRIVQTTVSNDLKHQGNWTEYLSAIPAATLAAPPSIGWKANAGDAVPAADIVYAPGTKGDAVELLDSGQVIATAHTNAAGVAVLPPNPTATGYRIVDLHGRTVQSGDFAHENLDTWPVHW